MKTLTLKSPIGRFSWRKADVERQAEWTARWHAMNRSLRSQTSQLDGSLRTPSGVPMAVIQSR